MRAQTLVSDVREARRSARGAVQEALDVVLRPVTASSTPSSTVLSDEALAHADEVDFEVAAGRDPGPLAGVPVALKDNLCTRGAATNGEPGGSSKGGGRPTTPRS